jgi:hypothetical protein
MQNRECEIERWSKGTRVASSRLSKRNQKAAIKRRIVSARPRKTPHSAARTRQREAHLRTLAGKLLFRVEKSGDRFTLSRTADVSRPVCHSRLSLKQAEELLSTWKLRGLQGG